MKIQPGGIENATYYRQKLKPLPPGSISTTTYSNQFYGGKVVPFTTSNLLDENGWRNPAPYRIYVVKVTPVMFDYTYKSGTLTYREWGKTPIELGQGAGSGIPFHGMTGASKVPDVSDNMRDRAVAECLVKLKDQKLNVLVGLGEINKTLAMLARFLKTLGSAYRAARKGDLKTAAKILGVTPSAIRGSWHDQWLALKYGWLPLMSDIHGAAQLLEGQFRKDKNLFSVVRRIEDSYPDPIKPASKVVWRIKGSTRIGVEVKFYAKLSSVRTAFASSIGLTNPLLIAWELVPFSFVVDWVLPIGTWLSAMDSTLGISFSGGYWVKKSWSDFTVTFSQAAPLSPAEQLPELRVQNICLERGIYLDFPIPQLYVKSPFKLSNLISALALIKQARR